MFIGKLVGITVTNEFYIGSSNINWVGVADTLINLGDSVLLSSWSIVTYIVKYDFCLFLFYFQVKHSQVATTTIKYIYNFEAQAAMFEIVI